MFHLSFNLHRNGPAAVRVVCPGTGLFPYTDTDKAVRAAFGMKGDFDRDEDVDGDDLAGFTENFGR